MEYFSESAKNVDVDLFNLNFGFILRIISEMFCV